MFSSVEVFETDEVVLCAKAERLFIYAVSASSTESETMSLLLGYMEVAVLDVPDIFSLK